MGKRSQDQQQHNFFYFNLRECQDFKFRHKIKKIAFLIISFFWLIDIFFVAGYVFSNNAGVISVLAVLIGFALTIFGKFMQCKEILSPDDQSSGESNPFIHMYCGLTAIINAVFAKTRQEQGAEGFSVFGVISGYIVILLQLLASLLLLILLLYIVCMLGIKKDPDKDDSQQQRRVQREQRQITSTFIVIIKFLVIISIPIFGWIGFVYHFVFAFAMTVLSQYGSDSFVVVAPVLDVLLYILELQVYLCKSRVMSIVQYPRDRSFRNQQANSAFFPRWYDAFQTVQLAFNIVLMVLIVTALIIFSIEFPKTPPFILFFVLVCVIIFCPLTRMIMLTHYQKLLRFKPTAPLALHAMTGSFFVVIVFHFMQFGNGWGLFFWLGFGLLGNYILARVMIIRVYTYGDKKRFFILGDDLFQIILFWIFKVLNYMACFFDIFLYWNDGFQVGHIVLDVVLLYDLLDFLVTFSTYAIMNNKCFKKLLERFQTQCEVQNQIMSSDNDRNELVQQVESFPEVEQI